MKNINTACIIDDDSTYIFCLKRIMKTANFCNTIKVYNNGKHALDHLKYKMENQMELPDVILLDLNMPVMDGWQFLDQYMKIKKKKSIPIYIVSSSIDPADKNKLSTYPEVTNFISKPIDKKKLNNISSQLVN